MSKQLAPLVEIVERDGRAIKTVRIGDKLYHSIAETARQAEVTHATVWRWYKRGKITGCYHDDMGGDIYVPKDVVENLKPENRFRPL